MAKQNLTIQREKMTLESAEVNNKMNQLLYNSNDMYGISFLLDDFYYIRNAIAHGYFEVIKQENVYKMKCIKNNKLKSAMRLHENILINFIEIACKNVTELKKLQNKYLKNK